MNLNLTRTLPNPNQYVEMMCGEFASWAFDEERAPKLKGLWRSQVFKCADEIPVDLEIGPGNGVHFAHQAKSQPGRCLVGIELKYKPLIQSIRRAIRAGCRNARIMRYDAAFPGDIFADGELNDVYVHFPDPWEKKRSWKHRLIDEEFLETLYRLQRPGSVLDFKTDSNDYFAWSLERFQKSRYRIEGWTRNLHQSEWQERNFITHFESLFLRQGLAINYARLRRD